MYALHFTAYFLMDLSGGNQNRRISALRQLKDGEQFPMTALYPTAGLTAFRLHTFGQKPIPFFRMLSTGLGDFLRH